VMGAKLIGVDIKDCIVVEDSRNGLIAGRDSGASVIGIASTLPRETVFPLCDLTVNAVSELTVGQVIGMNQK